MAEIKTIYKGESVTLLFTFPEAYNMARLASHKVFVGETEFTGVIEGKTIRMQLKSSDTDRMIGTHRIVCLIDDTTLGLRKPYCGELVVSKTQASGSTVSVSNISDIIIPIVISETAITAGDVMYNYVKGDKGDPFTYSDFTPEQIAELQQPAADAIASIQEVELEVETAEGLRVQAELNRQTNTATAIQNAETATQNANTAAENVVDGKSVELQTTATNVQWRMVGDVNWTNLIALSAITGVNGKEVELQTAGGYIQWRLTGGTWLNLVEINSLITAKENTANKQNSLAVDGTGTKFPTVDAVNEGLLLKQDANLIASYIHSGNLEVAVQSIDIASNTFTKMAHGLINGDRVAPILNINVVDAYPYNVYPIGLANPDNGYYVINATNDTFQLSLTSGGASITLSTNATMNLTKWHFEKRVELVYENTNILFSTDFRIVYGLRILTSSNFYSYNGISGIWSGNDYYPSSSNYNNIYAYPYTPINPCHFGHGEQKFMSHYMMNSIHLIARIQQTGIVDRLSMKFIDISKTVNSEQIQSKTLRLSAIFPANGFSFKIYKI